MMRRLALAALGLWLAIEAPQVHAQAGALTNPVAALSLEQLSATRERPLFSPSRQPPAPPAAPAPPPQVAEAPPPPPAAPPTLTLFGIVGGPEGARAIVRTQAGSEVLRLRVGDTVQGWEVSDIARTELVLRLGDRVETVALFAPGSRKAAAPPTTAWKPPMAVTPMLRTAPKSFESDGL
jgi:general secretion pathway protein N